MLAFAAQGDSAHRGDDCQMAMAGFAHGVMNTDNLNITGSTLDFGPYGSMERFRPNWINKPFGLSGPLHLSAAAEHRALNLWTY